MRACGLGFVADDGGNMKIIAINECCDEML
jgi:hypothetical protein